MENGNGSGEMENGSRKNATQRNETGLFHGNDCLSCECQLHWGPEFGSPDPDSVWIQLLISFLLTTQRGWGGGRSF